MAVGRTCGLMPAQNSRITPGGLSPPNIPNVCRAERCTSGGWLVCRHSRRIGNASSWDAIVRSLTAAARSSGAFRGSRAVMTASPNKRSDNAFTIGATLGSMSRSIVRTEARDRSAL